MDSLHFCIAIVPVCVYLFLIGWVNSSARPLVTTGIRDLSALAVATSGFAISGPMELFFPETLASLVGAAAWVPLLLLYALVVTLILLMTRPRLIVYNMPADRLRPVVVEAIAELDCSARWAGDCVIAPELGVQLAIESHPGIRNAALVAIGPQQHLDGWDKLKWQLKLVLADHEQLPSTQGLGMFFLSAVLAAAVVYSLFTGRQEIAESFRDMLRM